MLLRAYLGSTHPRTVKPIYWHQFVVKESAAFIAGHQAKSSSSSSASDQKPKLPNGFQQSIFKGKVKKGEFQGMWSARAQFSNWLMVR